MNKAQLERKIKQDGIRRVNYFIRKGNDVVFNRPIKEVFFDPLGHDKPFDPDAKPINVFYIPQDEYKKLMQIFKDHEIPEYLYTDLTWAYLNMCFASTNALFRDKFHRDLNAKRKELYKLFDLLEEILSKKKILRGFTLETRDILGERKFGPLKSKKFSGHIAARFIEDVINKFKEAKMYEMLQREREEIYEKYGFTDSTSGKKNHEKQSQQYYCNVLFDYLRQELFRPAYNAYSNVLSDPKKFEGIFKKMSRKYSRNKRYLFIGKLMIFSGLIQDKELIDSEIIDQIEKKLLPKLQKEKKHIAEVEERNRQSTDGSIEILNVITLF